MSKNTVWVSSFGGYFMWSKPKPTQTITKSSETSSSNANGNIPQAAVGMPVAAVLGHKRVPDANTIWTGNLRPLTETTTTSVSETEEIDAGGGVTETVTTTKTVTTVATVGYLIDIHMGICLGPDVRLIGIYVDNAPIWTGDIGPARTEFTIGENLTFLSKAECVFSGGAFDQAPEPGIDVPDYPGYVGIATIFLKNVRADLPMGNLSFEVVRLPNPLALSDGDNTNDDDDLNLASALVEVITNEWGYGGLDIASLDTEALGAIALVLKNEANFCSVKIGSDTSVAAVIKSIQAQADMIVFENPSTALITGKLIRAEYIDYVAIGKRFNQGNIIEMRSFEKSYWPDTIEQARGLYTERDADYNEVPVFMQNTANISESGRGKRTANIYYPYVPNKLLALDLLSRDLAILAAPNYSFSLLANREAAGLLPGDMIVVNYPPFNLLNVPMCVTRSRKQDIKSNNVLLALRQMKFPDTEALFGAGGAGYDPGFDTSPQTPTKVVFYTAPYFFARSAFGITSAQVTPLVYPVILPVPANEVQFSFSALIENVPNTVNDTTIIDNGLFPTYAKLNGAIGQYDGFDTGEVASIFIDGVINSRNLIDIGEAGVRAGQLFVLIGNEILSFEDVTDNGDGTWTLSNVHRALLDTVFEAHADNSDVFIIGNNFNFIAGGFSYPLSYTPDWAIISNALMESGVKADALLSDDWSPSNNRTLAPLRPHNTKINGAARSSTPVAITEGDSVTVTWAIRARTKGTVSLMLDASEPPEGRGSEVQKHVVIHRSAGGTLTELATVTAATATFTMPDVADGAGTIYVEARMTLGGVEYASIAQDRIPVTVSPAP